MGREIRRVPPNWEHPKEHKWERNWRTGQFEETNEYKPMFDKSFEERAKEWLGDMQKWLDGRYYDKPEDNDYAKTIRAYSDYCGKFPDPNYYRPEWTEEECTAYQIYETVSEGTPTSPVFQTEQEMIDWLVSEGRSLYAATEFVKGSWAPSMVMRVASDGTVEFATGIDSFDMK